MVAHLTASLWLHDIWHPLTGKGYQFWSGIGSDLSELTLLGIAVGGWRRINCHAPRCFRFGQHPTADGYHRLCRKHHPDLPDHRLTLTEIERRHRAATSSDGGKR
jgi:hypothetical protein